jgi:cytochrome d ubiquinol oxidase subunit II
LSFALGSLLAAAAQGWMLGSYLTGFDHGLWSTLFILGIALTLPTAYEALGAGWLIMKTGDVLQGKAVRWARAAMWPMGVALVGISLATPLVSHTVFERWFAMPQFLGLLPIPVACVVAFSAAFHVTSRPRIVEAGYGWVVFASTVLIFVLSFLGLAYSLYPYIVIDRLTIWQAASATESLIFIFVGVAITLPAIIVYTIFMYRAVWGRASALTYGPGLAGAEPPQAG